MGDVKLGEIKKILGGIKHPAIDETLENLGMIKGVEIKRNKVSLVLALPFENVPIKEDLIGLIKKTLADKGFVPLIKTAVMDKKELEKFLAAEQVHWRG